VSIRSDPLDELVIPDGTHVEEHDLVTNGDVIVGGQSDVEFGVRGHNVIAGERVSFGGHIEAEGDCRLDMWSDVADDLLVGRDAYLGERVSVGGELKVAQNLDIGDDVTIEDGFEANGWIEIRNPMPTIVFLVMYLSHLLRMGEEEAAEELASEFAQSDDHDHDPVVVPRSARVSDDVWRVSTPARIGRDCRLHGNVRADAIDFGDRSELFGSLRGRGDITIAAEAEIHGDVTTRRGDVRVERGAHVWGDISAEDVELHEHAIVEGRIRVSGELTQIRDTLGPEPAPDDRQEEVTAFATEAEATTVETGDTEDETEGDSRSQSVAKSQAVEASEESDDSTDAAGDENESPTMDESSEKPPASEAAPTDAASPELGDWGDGETELDVALDDVPFSTAYDGSDDVEAESGHDEDAELVPDAE
jgi:predicted acyltransferase (DUF342 family)